MDKTELTASNIIDLDKFKTVRDIRSLRFLKVYAVRADPMTGKWLEEPFSTGETITSETWLAQEDLSDVHFTTFKQIVGARKQEVICALIVNWIHESDLN